MKINVHMAGWRQDYLEAAGYPTMPKTWDEVDRMLPKIKAATAKDNVIPFSIQRDIWRTLGTTFATFTEKTMDDQGVFRVDSPEWLEMIGMFKKWIDAGLARFDTVEDAVDAWQKGKFAMSLTSHSWVRLGRQVWGADKVKGGVPPQANATAPARTWCHIDSSCVFVDAPNAQDATDWLLAILGPEGTPAETWYKGTLTFSGSPPYQSMIDKFVTPNPDIKEIGDVLAILPNSTIATIVQANGFGITQLKLAPWLDRYFKGELSAKDAMTKFRAEVDAEFAKQKA
jgi:ABC-type glycerol-3-phosphate transport system substrate-binding protein